MKILLTNDQRTIGGGENFVLFLAEGLRAKGHTVLISPLSASVLSRKARERHFETHEVLYASHGKEFHSARILRKMLDGRKVDLIHTNSYLDRTVASLAAWQLRIPCIASVHSCFSIQHNITHWIRNRFLIHHFVTDGYSTKKLMMKNDGIREDRITVIHNGLPQDTVQINDEDRAAIRQEFGIPLDAIVLTNIASFVEFKGQRSLIDAMKCLVERHTNVHCLLVGDGELSGDLQHHTKEMELENKIHFAGYRTDISALLSASDVYVQPSLNHGGETFPLSIISALLAKLPVVSSDVGDIRYLVRHEENGLLLQPALTDQLVAALDRIITSAETRMQFGIASRNLYEKEYTSERMVEKFEALYLEILHRYNTAKRR